MTGPDLRHAPHRRRIVPARDIRDKLARVASLEELDGYVAGLAHRGREPSAEEVQAIARRRAELMKGGRT